MLPFSYATRNLFRDKARLLQTVGGSAMVVLLVMGALAINQGMKQVLAASGSPHNVILLGAGSEESVQRSEVAEQAAGIAGSEIPGVTEVMGTRAVSTEIHYMGLARFPGGSEAQALFRGVTPTALLTHPEVQLTEGRYPRTGEVMVGRLAWRQMKLSPTALRPGATLLLEDQELTVSGIFAAPGTVMESEVWLPIGDLRVMAQRDSVSCVVLRLDDPDDFAEADLFAKRRLDLELSALRESDYYARLNSFFAPLRAMTWLTAGLIAIGALFGGLNTLYAAFASRIREMATLQAIGFGRGALLTSLIQESTLACLTGAFVASVVALLALDGLVVPFSIGTFAMKISPSVALTGILTGCFLGLLGALPPAIRCLKPALPVALRSS
ncbi:ABC transporter permease [Haloferula rosea]|uniref:ABC transporter permease n=1 Tax=Haloferula rosea TaxID=490093 RepID=A0A934RG76_9BACT|nr:ABC transporter permease [Haloferula rosea]MBK1828594.1 ABC transporter permease [Haloferula rosea]